MYQVTDEQIDRLKNMQEQLNQIRQKEGIPFEVDELSQRLRWWIEEVMQAEEQEA